ncbi:hypothetical protein MTR72_38475 [Bradyrhizobium sp. ISRA442]|uniref:hypothetical protein n=1 Tax=Bradyrhizobium sp. ISRA442 TaxID=2866197 RepID=UPI00311B4340
MWQGIQRRFYSMMYYFGRTPPTSAEIDAAFEKIEAERQSRLMMIHGAIAR